MSLFFETERLTLRSFTEQDIDDMAAKNFRSLRVMEKIGMVRDAAHDFDHPNVAPGHALRPHVLYRLRRDAWNA